MNELIRMRGVTKVYGNGIVANYRVDFSLQRGEIHAVAGENGAGKSTLMKILYGMERADEGAIELDGKEVSIRSPKDAMALGIGMVHQHFMLVNELTVAENVFLGHPMRKKGFLDRKAMRHKTGELAALLGADVDPDAVCAALPVGIAQKVEIMKTLARGAKILILDEPTAVLTPYETDMLFDKLRTLRDEGMTVVIITHKLDELMRLCDRVTVMKDGRSRGCYRVADITADELTRLMVDRTVQAAVRSTGRAAGEPVLQVSGLYLAGSGGKPRINGVSFSVHAGEILCFAGVEGNGQRETVECICGKTRGYAGDVVFRGQQLRGRSIRSIRRAGISHIPEDRLKYGADADGSILDNLISLDYREHARFGFLQYRLLRRRAQKQIADYGIKAFGIRQRLAMLSGGNMQKVVIAREMDANPTLLLANQPTRGVDVGAMELIHGHLTAMRDRGCAVLLVSADLTEVLSLSDRILVFHEGEITAEITDVAACTDEVLGRYMLGLDRMERGSDGATA